MVLIKHPLKNLMCYRLLVKLKRFGLPISVIQITKISWNNLNVSQFEFYT